MHQLSKLESDRQESCHLPLGIKEMRTIFLQQLGAVEQICLTLENRKPQGEYNTRVLLLVASSTANTQWQSRGAEQKPQLIKPEARPKLRGTRKQCTNEQCKNRKQRHCFLQNIEMGLIY